MTFTFTTAAEVPLRAIVRAINLVYPQHNDSLEHYAEQLRTSQVDLARSIVALDDANAVAGLAMLGVRGDRGWCGDAAVIPEYQNQKLGQALMRQLSESARQAGLHTLTLEVRDNNTPARRVYEKEGYAYTRRMVDLVTTTRELREQALCTRQALNIGRAPDQAQLLATLVHWSNSQDLWPPCWERELPSILSNRSTSLWTATNDGRELACLVGECSEANRLNIQYLGLSSDTSPADVLALLATASRNTPVETVRIGLEPAESRTAEMLRAIGFKPSKDLWEMVKVLL